MINPDKLTEMKRYAFKKASWTNGFGIGIFWHDNIGPYIDYDGDRVPLEEITEVRGPLVFEDLPPIQ